MRTTDLGMLREPQNLIENRVSFAGPESELSIYDTYATASRVGLDADQLLYCGMVTGRKVMHHAHHTTGQVFLPHESFMLAPGERVEIDFPDASLESPTTCLTIEIAKEKVESAAERMSDLCRTNSADDHWQHESQVLHAHHTSATQQLLGRLVSLFTENNPDRDAMVELGVNELIIRMLRHQQRDLLLNYCSTTPDASSITAALHYIEQHLAEPLQIEQLSKVACMSRSRLYTAFKKQLGCTPCELQQQLRLKKAAKRLQRGESITQVCYELGFSSPSHFSRRFRHFFGLSPRKYRESTIAKIN